MAIKGQHVVPSGGKWKVVRSGAERATGVFRTQEEAVTRATEIARNNRSELYIHGVDGRIRDRRSYGTDPFPPKG